MHVAFPTCIHVGAYGGGSKARKEKNGKHKKKKKTVVEVTVDEDRERDLWRHPLCEPPSDLFSLSLQLSL